MHCMTSTLLAHKACIELHDHVILLYNISLMKEIYAHACVIYAILDKWVSLVMKSQFL